MLSLNISSIKKSNFLYHAALLLFLICFFGLLAVYLGEDSNWDLRNYHYYNGFAFLHHRMGWDIAPARFQTYFNPLLDVVNYSIIQFFPPKVGEFLLGTFHGLAVYFFLLIAILVFNVYPSRRRLVFILLAAVIGVTAVASYSQMGTTFNESTVTAFVMASLLLAIKAMEEGLSSRRQVWAWLLSALILGLGLGLKLTAASFVVGYFIAFLLYQKPNRIRIKLIFGILFFLSMGFIITDGFWMAFLYKKFHSPFFPFYNKIFHSAYTTNDSTNDNFHLPRNLISAVLYPFYGLQKTSQLQGYSYLDWRYAATIVLGILWIFQCALKKNQRFPENSHSIRFRFLFIFWIASYTTWLFQFALYRYTIPLAFLSGIFIIYFCVQLVRPVVLQIGTVSAITVFLLTTTVPFDGGHVKYSKNFIEVKTPVIPPQSVILMMNHKYAYLIPFFPGDTRFIGFYNLFIVPNTLLYQEVINLITQYNGAIYIMESPDFSFKEINILNKFGFTINPHCLMIQSNLENSPLSLCPLEHTLVSKEIQEGHGVVSFNPEILEYQNDEVDSQNILKGSYPIEIEAYAHRKFVWIRKDAEITLRRPDKNSFLNIEGYVPFTLHQQANKDLEKVSIQVLINHHVVKTVEFKNNQTFGIKMNPGEIEKWVGNNSSFDLTIQASNETSPAEVGLGKDKRKLAIIIGYIGQNST